MIKSSRTRLRTFNQRQEQFLDRLDALDQRDTALLQRLKRLNDRLDSLDGLSGQIPEEIADHERDPDSTAEPTVRLSHNTDPSTCSHRGSRSSDEKGPLSLRAAPIKTPVEATADDEPCQRRPPHRIWGANLLINRTRCQQLPRPPVPAAQRRALTFRRFDASTQTRTYPERHPKPRRPRRDCSHIDHGVGRCQRPGPGTS